MRNIGRKAQLAWASFIMINVWLGLDKLDSTTYLALTTLIFGIYATANVVSKGNTV